MATQRDITQQWLLGSCVKFS